MLEGMVIMATCDKVVPGMLMGALRVNIPTVMFTGGYMAAGRYKGRMLTLTHTKQAYAAYIAGDMSEEDYKGIVRNACPTPAPAPLWAQLTRCVPWPKCWALPPMARASCRSQTPRWHELARAAARQVMEAWKNKVRPSDIIGQESFENVVRYMMATGGSTNSVLHIPALARQVGCDITPETFDAISPSGAGHQHHLSEPPHLYHGGVRGRRRPGCRGEGTGEGRQN